MKLYGVMGWKNSGKTGLVERLVAEITGRGLSVSTIKHAHHDVDLDQPGKDTFRHRQAGAHEVLMASPQRYAILHETRGGVEPALADLAARLTPVDLVLVEGYKRDPHPKIEVLRRETGQPLIQPADPTVRAVASNAGLQGLSVPHFDLDDTGGIADFLLADCGLTEDRFDTVVVVDWSARSTLSPAKPTADSIWIGMHRAGFATESYHRSRAAAERALAGLFAAERAAGRRVLATFDIAFGYPTGFAEAVTGSADPLVLWDWLESRITDDAGNDNNRFALAAALNRQFPGVGPFWGRPGHLHHPDLPERGSARHSHGQAENRAAEQVVPRAQSVWKLYTTGSVGSQTLLGLPVLARLRRIGAAVWPFQPPVGPLVFAETYTGLIDPMPADPGIKDQRQVRALARAYWTLSQTGGLAALLADPGPVARAEGWMLGAGHRAALVAAAWPGPEAGQGPGQGQGTEP